ncbi:MAG: ZIP family metal transporter [Syntrophobacterales bacterium]|jgi:zinc and cadmium transporter
MVLGWIVLFSVLGSIGAVLGAALILVFPKHTRTSLIPNLISYATGTLLGAVFLGLLPRALQKTSPQKILICVLIGILLFFILEKLVIWRHCHDAECEVHGTAGPLILFGDAFHNITDGVIIAGAFLISIPLGVATGLAVVAHEIPQEVGDFGILLDSGYSRLKALIYNTLSSLSTLPGALLGYYFFSQLQQVLPYVAALGAASFLYIALVDLTPALHRRPSLLDSLFQLCLIVAGIITIWLIRLG